MADVLLGHMALVLFYTLLIAVLLLDGFSTGFWWELLSDPLELEYPV